MPQNPFFDKKRAGLIPGCTGRDLPEGGRKNGIYGNSGIFFGIKFIFRKILYSFSAGFKFFIKNFQEKL